MPIKISASINEIKWYAEGENYSGTYSPLFRNYPAILIVAAILSFKNVFLSLTEFKKYMLLLNYVAGILKFSFPTYFYHFLLLEK